MSSAEGQTTDPELLEPTLAGSGETPARRSRVRVGQVLADRYLLKRFIAAGGMGEVWEAEDALLRETVALKLLKGDSSAEAVARLKSEVTLARRITHRNVCRIHEFAAHRPKGEEPIFFFTMELLQGVTLSELLASRGPLPEAEVLEIVVQLAAGLDAAHRAGVIHRDFKSANVFVEPGEHPRVVITDFGIARAIEPGPRISEASGALLGTPAYMAPEQVDGRDAVPASDLYALGIVTFELLTGRLPYDGATPISQAMARLSHPPPDVSQFRADLSAHWPEALHQIFSRRPEDRLQSGEAFVNALRDASFIDRPGLRVRVRAGLTTVLIAALTMAGFWWVFGADRRQWADVPTSTASSPESARALRDVMVAHSTIQGRPDPLRNLVAADPEFVEARFQLLYLDAFASTNRPPTRTSCCSRCCRGAPGSRGVIRSSSRRSSPRSSTRHGTTRHSRGSSSWPSAGRATPRSGTPSGSSTPRRNELTMRCSPSRPSVRSTRAPSRAWPTKRPMRTSRATPPKRTG